ncbi:MAG TPA: hypothetical protein VGD65_25115 [Chryseosolibacter sp.]
MRSLLFSIALLGTACASEYKGLRPVKVDERCLTSIRPPALTTAWYDAGIDVVGKHISGLLLIKEMPDFSRRVVFTNEAGVTFFDFGYDPAGKFKVHYVIRQLDKKAVIRLLRNDFALLLGIPFQSRVWKSWEMNGEKYFGVGEKKQNHFLITREDCGSLLRLETASKRKKMLTIAFSGSDVQRPESITLQHHTFAMQINLKKLIR